MGADRNLELGVYVFFLTSAFLVDLGARGKVLPLS